MSSQKKTVSESIQLGKKRGRPKKASVSEETSKQDRKRKNQLTLIQKQNIKLKRQRERQARKKLEGGKQNKEKFYCTNRELQNELLKWRNSTKDGLRICRIVGEDLVPTKILDTPEMHEEYRPGTRYFVKYGKNHPRYSEQVENGVQFYRDLGAEVIEDVTQYVENSGWAFDIDDPNERTMSNELGNMIIHMADKILNHSNFRNYKQELKEDAKSFFYLKVIKGLKNYNFKFNNPFAYFSQCAFNSYLSIITQHYKHLNTKKEVLKQIYSVMQSYSGIDPRSSLNRYIKEYIDSGAESKSEGED